MPLAIYLLMYMSDILTVWL